MVYSILAADCTRVNSAKTRFYVFNLLDINNVFFFFVCGFKDIIYIYATASGSRPWEKGAFFVTTFRHYIRAAL